jgi:xanthine dehydrogenase accessory factor
MIISVVGSGGKTTLIKKLAARYRREGKTVLVTTTTHMYLEEDTLLTDDANAILQALKATVYVMAGVPVGPKIKALSKATFDAVCGCADVVLVEADGSKGLPLKYPNATEPVIPENTDEILVVCGLNAIGQPAKAVCHRLELVTACLGIREDTVITAAHVQKLVTEGYLKPLKAAFPGAKVTLMPRHDGSAYQRAIASLLETGRSVLAQEAGVPMK